MSLTFINAEKHIHDTLIFSSFHLKVESGNIVAIHSSLNVQEQMLQLLLRKTSLSSGQIKINEVDIFKSKQKMGFLFRNDGLYERLTIREMLSFVKSLYHSTKSINDTIHMVRLDEKRKSKIANLSYSEKKRVQFACLLIQNPEIYILEEPDQNLDIESKRIFLSLLNGLKKDRKTMFILTGNLESAITLADEIYRLDEQGIHSIQTKIEDEIEEMNENSQSKELGPPIRLEKIATKINDKIVLFDPTEIDYIESNEGQSFLHIKGESFPTVITLNELAKRLLPFGFFRCHRSYIVNLQKVREVITWTRNSFSLVLDNEKKSTIPLSKTRMADLKSTLGIS